MGEAERRRVAAKLGKASEQRRGRCACQQSGKQRIFLRARRVDIVAFPSVRFVEIGTKYRAAGTRRRFDREHALGRTRDQLEIDGWEMPILRASSVTPPAARIAFSRPWSSMPVAFFLRSFEFLNGCKKVVPLQPQGQ
jgi:hypothetical protein